MPRLAKLRKKNGYWYTGAGGGRYFGRVADVRFEVARAKFTAHLARVASTRRAAGSGMVPVADLVERFAGRAGRPPSGRVGAAGAAAAERDLHLRAFCRFACDGVVVGDLPAAQIRARHLEAFLADLRARGVDRRAVDAHFASVDECFAWASGRIEHTPGSTTVLPWGFDPFREMKPGRAAAAEAVGEGNAAGATTATKPAATEGEACRAAVMAFLETVDWDRVAALLPKWRSAVER